MKLIASFCLAAFVQAADLQPLLARPDQIVFQDDFSKPAPLDNKAWTTRLGTPWAAEQGGLRGKPSALESQASKKVRQGLEPRLSAPITPSKFLAV
jgi:hypothetical protein